MSNRKNVLSILLCNINIRVACETALIQTSIPKMRTINFSFYSNNPIYLKMILISLIIYIYKTFVNILCSPSLGMTMSDGFSYPSLVSFYSGIHARDVPLPTPDAEAHDSHLVPMPSLFAHQGPPAVALRVAQVV